MTSTRCGGDTEHRQPAVHTLINAARSAVGLDHFVEATHHSSRNFHETRIGSSGTGAEQLSKPCTSQTVSTSRGRGLSCSPIAQEAGERCPQPKLMPWIEGHGETGAAFRERRAPQSDRAAAGVIGRFAHRTALARSRPSGDLVDSARLAAIGHYLGALFCSTACVNASLTRHGNGEGCMVGEPRERFREATNGDLPARRNGHDDSSGVAHHFREPV